MSDPLLTVKEVAVILGLSVHTLNIWRSRNMGPKYIRLNARVIRYRRSDVDSFLESRRVVPALMGD